jgi:hypothetical protein
MTTCAIDGCDRPVLVKSRGWCRTHYYRWWNHGDPLKKVTRRSSGTNAERWWSKVNKDGPDGCWLWSGSLDRNGYGQFDTTDGGHVNHRAHRFGYKMLVRSLDDEETLDHLCRVHACVNPSHLEPVEHVINVQRGESGRHNAVKTHCPQGHEYTPENTVPRIRGQEASGRECLTCRRDHSRERTRQYRARKKAAQT